MLLRDFPGADDFIRALDIAVDADCPETVTDNLRGTLCRLIRDQAITLPACVYEANSDHYARRELYQSEVHGYSVIAMTWGPGQGTQLHDHCGMWCVEGVWHGALEIVQYDLERHEDDRYRFRAVGSIQAGTGSAGSLIPPYEYHTIRNPSTDSPAVSVHIYKGRMRTCAVFKPLGNQWYERGERQLALD